MISKCVISLFVVGACCRPEIHGDKNATKVGVLSQLKGNRGRNLDESPTSIIQRQRKAGTEAGQKVAARLEQKGAGVRFGGDGEGQTRGGYALDSGIRKRVEGVQGKGGSRLLEVAGGRLSVGGDREHKFSRGGEGGDDNTGGQQRGGSRGLVGGDGQVPSLELRGDGFGGLAAGICEGSLKPAGKPYVGANGEGLLGGDGGRLSFGGLQGNHTLDLGGLDRDGGLQGGFGGLGGLGRDHDGMWGGCEPPSTTSTTTATVSTVTASTTVTGTSTTTVGGRRLLPEGVGAGLLNGGGHSDDHDHHTDGDHADDGHHTDEIELTMTTTDAPHTYDPVDYVADKLRETDGWVLVQWPESKTGVKFPVRLLKKQRNAMAVEDVVLLYILRNGGVSEHVMTYFAGRSADAFMRNPSDIFAEKYEEFVNLLDMLWDLFSLTAPPPPTTTTSTTTATWTHGTSYEATTDVDVMTTPTWTTAGPAAIAYTTTTTLVVPYVTTTTFAASIEAMPTTTAEIMATTITTTATTTTTLTLP